MCPTCECLQVAEYEDQRAVAPSDRLQCTYVYKVVRGLSHRHRYGQLKQIHTHSLTTPAVRKPLIPQLMGIKVLPWRRNTNQVELDVASHTHVKSHQEYKISTVQLSSRVARMTCPPDVKSPLRWYTLAFPLCTDINSYKKKKKKKQIGHHARPRRASATAPRRTGAPGCCAQCTTAPLGKQHRLVYTETVQ